MILKCFGQLKKNDYKLFHKFYWGSIPSIKQNNFEVKVKENNAYKK